MKVVVTGGRTYDDKAYVYEILDSLLEMDEDPIDLLIEGGATGADRLAREWAKERGVPYKTMEADWDKYKKAAGPIRNNEMLMLLDKENDLVVQFKGNRGTTDCVTQAKRLGIMVLEHEEE